MEIMTRSLSGMFRMLRVSEPTFRVANLSYLQAGWYVAMMKQKAYESEALPLTFRRTVY
jgi:hypothetical protein